jgi:hypothetical protein
MRRLYDVKEPDYAIFYLTRAQDLKSLKKHYPSLTFHSGKEAQRYVKVGQVGLIISLMLTFVYVYLQRPREKFLTALVYDSVLYLVSVLSVCFLIPLANQFLIFLPDVRTCSRSFVLYYLVWVSFDLIFIIKSGAYRQMQP